MKTAACAKHFAVHSGPESVRHEFDAQASKKDMYETYLPAFEACVKEAGVEAVMGAYNRTNGEPCCGSPTDSEYITGGMGFPGTLCFRLLGNRRFPYAPYGNQNTGGIGGSGAEVRL